MIDPPHITQSEAQWVAFVHLTVPKYEIQRVMGPGLLEVKAALAGQGIKPNGAWFTHHLRVDPDVFDFKICIPVPTAITPSGRVEAGHLPEQKVARTIYRGPYEGLAHAWAEFGQWIAKQGYKPESDVWEVYLAGPERNTDPAEWETELNRPIA